VICWLTGKLAVGLTAFEPAVSLRFVIDCLQLLTCRAEFKSTKPTRAKEIIGLQILQFPSGKGIHRLPQVLPCMELIIAIHVRT
jgi:hypothetical protein